MDSFKKIILEELEQSKKIISSGAELAPRFRILTDENDFIIFTPFTNTDEKRELMKDYIKTIMLWKSAKTFIMSAEMIEPKAFSSVCINANGSLAGLHLFNQNPLSFEPVQWLGQEYIDPDISEMLPRSGEELNREQFAEAEKLFGVGGKFEVRPVLH